MIIAICIYTINNNAYVKTQYAQQDRGLFPSNQLEKLEAFSLQKFQQNTQDKLQYYLCENEHHYLFRPTSENVLLTIVSKTPLVNQELRHLFTNIEHVRLRPQSVKTSLDDIIRNPLAYTGKDLLVTAVQNELDETTKILSDAIDKIMLRGEKLQELDTQTLNLRYSAKRFEDEASKLNSCCRF